MNVKKILTLVVLATFGLSSQAQIVSSESENVYRIKTKKPKVSFFYIKAGIGSEAILFKHSGKTKIEETSFTAEADLGYKHSIGTKGFFWGAEAGVAKSQTVDESWGDDGQRFDTENTITLAITPLIGYDFKAGESTTLSPFLGPSIGLIDFEDALVGLSVGANIWFNQKWAIGVNFKIGNDTDRHQTIHRSIMLTGIIKL